MSEQESLAADAAKFVASIGLYLSPRQMTDLQATVRAFVRQAYKAGGEKERGDVLAFCRKMSGVCAFDVVVGSGWMALGDAVERGDHYEGDDVIPEGDE